MSLHSQVYLRASLLAAVCFAGGSAWVPAALFCVTAAVAASAWPRFAG